MALTNENNMRFDSLGVLFSALAFAGLLCALFLQRTELRLQREDLAATRKEMARTALANEQAAKNALIQSRVNFLLVKYQYWYPQYASAIKYADDEPEPRYPLERVDMIHKDISGIEDELEKLTKSVSSSVNSE